MGDTTRRRQNLKLPGRPSDVERFIAAYQQEPIVPLAIPELAQPRWYEYLSAFVARSIAHEVDLLGRFSGSLQFVEHLERRLHEFQTHSISKHFVELPDGDIACPRFWTSRPMREHSTEIGEALYRIAKSRPVWRRFVVAGYRFGLHNLRHSLSDWLVNKAKELAKTVQGILRHEKIQTTSDLYVQSEMDEMRAAQGAFLQAMV